MLTENQTEWQWTSGEPLAYTNWCLQEFPTRPGALVFVSIIDGKWRIGNSESLQCIGIALLEKADGQPDKPEKDK